MEGDEPISTPSAHIVGADLAALSIAELEARIGTLRAEIERIEQTLVKKRASLAAADAVFKI